MAKPPKKRAVRSLFELLALSRAPSDVRPAAPRGPAPFTPSVLRAGGLGPSTVPRRSTKWEKSVQLAQDIASALGPEGKYDEAVANAIFQMPQEIARDINNAKNPDDLVRALTGIQLAAGKRTPLNAVAVAALLAPEFAGVRRMEIAERAVAAAERNAARYAERSAPGLARFDPMNVPAFTRAGGSVRDIGHMLGTGDLAPIARRTPKPLDPSLDIPAFMRRADALAGTGPNRNPDVARVASMYRTRSGIRGAELPGVREVDPRAAKLMARTYESLQSNPNDPQVRAAYKALVREVDAQYKSIEDAGYHIEFVDKDPYKNSSEMMADLRDNRRLRVFRTGEGGHPILSNAENERFRAVHDFFGHAVQGNQFGPKGEEAAYRAHSAMFSPEAARAMATETRGQNSWVNFGPRSHLPVTERPYATQKAALWPAELMGDYPSFPEAIASPVVKGVDGTWYRGANHEMAREAAAEALRATPEGRAMIQANKGSASVRGSDAFETTRGRYITREDAKYVAGSAGQSPPTLPYTQLHSSDLLPQGEQHAPLAPKYLMTSARGRDLHDALLADEAARITRRNVPAFEAAAQTLPSPETFGAGAIAGAPKLGWYANSARALSESFGPEAPRFAALLSALSPQQSVEKNLAMALDTWEAWVAQGRPQDPKIIERIMHDVARRNPEGGQMGSRIPNALAALTAEDPASLALSGPKVFSFHRNLIGEAQRVTLDTWMAQLANVKPTTLARQARGVGVPSPTYLAYSGRVRQTAQALSKATGRTWTPAEVQETLWSWGKALSETSEPLTRGVHPSQFSLAGVLPQSMRDVIPKLSRASIEGVPDFASLLRGEPYSPTLGRLGLPTPGPSAPVAVPKLPPANPAALDELATNMERSQRGFFGNRRGAIGRNMKILRVENAQGQGPYHDMRTLSEVPWGDDLRTLSGTPLDRQPTPMEEGIPEYRAMLQRGTNLDPFRFGFTSVDQLKKWFTPEELAALNNLGHFVQPYEVPRVIYGEKQALFNASQKGIRQLNATPIAPSLPTAQANLFDNRVVIPAMLGATGGAGLGGLTLWEYLQGRK